MISMTADSRFGWAEFYMEFADRLLDHKADRGKLVAEVREVCTSLGYHYLDNSGTADAATGLPDICPFTTMGTFNRGISIANRKTIATEIGRFLGVKEPVPDSFDGVPTLNNQNSVVFWDRRDIGALWQVFEDAIQLADNEDERTRQSFVDSYDRALQGRGLGRTSRWVCFGCGPTDSSRWTASPVSTSQVAWESLCLSRFRPTVRNIWNLRRASRSGSQTPIPRFTRSKRFHWQPMNRRPSVQVQQYG